MNEKELKSQKPRSRPILGRGFHAATPRRVFSSRSLLAKMRSDRGNTDKYGRLVTGSPRPGGFVDYR